MSSKIVGHDIWYQIENNHSLVVGDSVVMKINWDRRYALMRLHFAAELILEIISKQDGLEKIGAHISQDKARIDFLWDQNISQVFERFLKEYRAIIDADVCIEKEYLDKENQRRYWEIKGFAKVPCGGTHVTSTAEVGHVQLKRKNIGKNKERIEISLV